MAHTLRRARMALAGAAVVGLLAALAPAFRASRMNVLRAIAADG